MNTIPPCPSCNTNKGARAQSGYYRCGKCGGLYDSEPNEGGDVHADPSRRMELRERRRDGKRRHA